jgi:hypothetical protein
MSKQIDCAPYLEEATDGEKVGRLPGKIELEKLGHLDTRKVRSEQSAQSA